MENIRGYQYKDEDLAFNKAVEQIEAKNVNLFNNREDRQTREKLARLMSEYHIHYYPLRFGFFKDSFVPKNIQDEVTEVFHSIFASKKS